MSAQKCSNCSAYWLQPLRRSCFVFAIGIRFCGCDANLNCCLSSKSRRALQQDRAHLLGRADARRAHRDQRGTCRQGGNAGNDIQCTERTVLIAAPPDASGSGIGADKILAGIRIRPERIGLVRMRGLPIAPMSWPYVEPLLGLHLHPSVENAAARKYERVRAVVIDDGQLKIAVERSGGYLLPHLNSLAARPTGALTYII